MIYAIIIRNLVQLDRFYTLKQSTFETHHCGSSLPLKIINGTCIAISDMIIKFYFLFASFFGFIPMDFRSDI